VAAAEFVIDDGMTHKTNRAEILSRLCRMGGFNMLCKTLLMAVGVLGFLSAPAWAATVDYKAAMSPSSEVPPVATSGIGTADAQYDTATHVLTYTITWSGLSGPATMAHFHGPAAIGANAGVAVKLGTDPSSPLTGHVKLTAAQAKELADGKWYANVHTAGNPKGELRGQMLKVTP
jgi:hypothetical protein